VLGPVLRDGFALSAAGDPQPFTGVVAAVPGVLAPAASPAERGHVLGAFGRLPPHPEVAPAMTRLADASGTFLASP
jgi:hypothetical protein